MISSCLSFVRQLNVSGSIVSSWLLAISSHSRPGRDEKASFLRTRRVSNVSMTSLVSEASPSKIWPLSSWLISLKKDWNLVNLQ
jgi:hypothetical protein